MNAPDKIYHCRFADGKYDFAYRLTPDPYCENTEYIRKDLLLKWAEDNLLECESSNDETDYGRIDAYKKLIDKLNSL